jgi:hypothetical protein
MGEQSLRRGETRERRSQVFLLFLAREYRFLIGTLIHRIMLTRIIFFGQPYGRSLQWTTRSRPSGADHPELPRTERLPHVGFCLDKALHAQSREAGAQQ